jgi:hypothetical protein
MQPTSRTRRLRTNKLYQLWRFAVINLKIMRVTVLHRH